MLSLVLKSKCDCGESDCGFPDLTPCAIIILTDPTNLTERENAAKIIEAISSLTRGHVPEGIVPSGDMINILESLKILMTRYVTIVKREQKEETEEIKQTHIDI